jgi:segregation and condensation protein A
MVQLPTEFRTNLESYRGPLDLLLFLIRRDEVDVFDIPIARIVEQYQIYLEILKDVDPNLCGEFLVMAANLMEIKSKMLLPREELAEDGELEDPRLELVRQLLEYKKYKERAMLLEMRMAERCRRHERPLVDLAPEEIDDGAPVDLGNISVWDLLTAFHRIQLALGFREPHRVVNRDRPIEEYVADVKEMLGSAPNRTAPFESLFAGVRTRQAAIGFFLAMLEMAKERMIVIFQDALFGPIFVKLRPEDEVRRLLEDREAAPAATEDPAARFLLEGEGRQALVEPIEPPTDPGAVAGRETIGDAAQGEGESSEENSGGSGPAPGGSGAGNEAGADRKPES